MVGDTFLICRASWGKLLTMISYFGWSAAVNQMVFFVTVWSRLSYLWLVCAIG